MMAPKIELTIARLCHFNIMVGVIIALRFRALRRALCAAKNLESIDKRLAGAQAGGAVPLTAQLADGSAPLKINTLIGCGF